MNESLPSLNSVWHTIEALEETKICFRVLIAQSCRLVDDLQLISIFIESHSGYTILGADCHLEVNPFVKGNKNALIDDELLPIVTSKDVNTE